MIKRFPSWILVLCLGSAAVAAACSSSSNSATGSGGGNGSGGGGGSAGTNTTVAGDLPCDVAQLMSDYCVTCHSNPPLQGVPISMLSYAGLTAPYKGSTVAQVALARMKDAASPMPPTGMLPAPQIAALESWINAGMPPGTCGTTPDDAGTTQYPLVCTSGTQWLLGNHGSQKMHPGVACIDCHSKSFGNEVPALLIAGTVYPSPREPDDCNGAPNITVEVTDSQNKTVTMTTNSAGNFMYNAFQGQLAPPFTAKVMANGQERAMKAPVPTGDCNSCHTQDGLNGAPGRIYAP